MRTLHRWGVESWIVLALIEAGYIVYYVKFKRRKSVEDPIIAFMIGILLLVSMAMICYLSL